MQFVKKPLLSLLLAGLATASMAQLKQLSNDQYFKGNLTGITQQLPTATRWLDNNNLIVMRDGKQFVVDAKKGTEREATDADKNVAKVAVKPAPFIRNKNVFIKVNEAEVQLTNDDAPEINPTVSPDGNYVAYTKKNDLYAVNVNTKKEIRLTNDGSDVILNGYSSWVYMEEILGRASRYKAFWWSPDSKSIAFFRSNDTEVPEFTITDGDGLHGYVEKVRYPKVGDKNPEVKVGLVKPEGGAITWTDFNEKDDQYFGKPFWKPDGSVLFVQWMNRKQNQLIVYAVNPSTGSKAPFYTEEQKTWVDLEGAIVSTFWKMVKDIFYKAMPAAGTIFTITT